MRKEVVMRKEVKFHVEGDLVVIDEPIALRSGDTLVIGHETVVSWIVANVDELVVPNDEGNGDALVYNLVHLARDGEDYRPYGYEADQDEEIASRFGLSER